MNMQDNKTKKGTFIIEINHTDNATWQGKITWADENRQEHFRSALELIKMIDGALNG